MLNDSAASDRPALLLVAAGALVDDNGRVLVQRRPPGARHAGLWEFPGGKLEGGETGAAALVRELDEELGIAVAPADAVPICFAEEGGAHPLILLLFAVHRWRGTPRAGKTAALRWVPPTALAGLPMPPLDVPLARALRQWLAVEARAGIEPACKDLQSSA